MNGRRLTGIIQSVNVDELSTLTGLLPAEVELALDDLESRGWITRNGDLVGIFGSDEP